ncbi:zf-HC2 domain-containing protein [Roseateles sp. MS654]|uniref:zf-HC2 domain-containing protein n=1 Tax=Roseateles sp. MS654 TaxID=3412685 RepID=UPI003C2DAB1E
MTPHDAPPGAGNDTTQDPVNAQPNEHRQVWDAIAWVAAGTATPEQLRLVQAHLPHCAHCREELALQQRIHQGMQDPPGLPVDEAAIQSGLDRLWARDRDAGPTMPVEAGRDRAANEGASRLTRWLSAAVAVQALALCVLGLRLWPGGQASSDYVTLSQPAALPGNAVVRLIPEERVDMGRLRQVLTLHGLRIVGADEDASSLLLAPLQPTAATAVPALVERLRAEPGVLMAEPVGAAAEAR